MYRCYLRGITLVGKSERCPKAWSARTVIVEGISDVVRVHMVKKENMHTA
jgi:hypothetical protein